MTWLDSRGRNRAGIPFFSSPCSPCSPWFVLLPAQAAAEHQQECAADGAAHVHFAHPPFLIIAEDEGHFPKDDVHPPQLEQDVHHALEALFVDKVVAVTLEGLA